MKGRFPTASRAPRFMQCPASEALPWVEEESSPAASRGRILHSFLERVNKVGREEALAEYEGMSFSVERAPERFRRAAHLAVKAINMDWVDVVAGLRTLDLSSLPLSPGSFASEVTLAWNPENGDGFAVTSAISPEERQQQGESYYTGRADVVAVDQEQKLGLIIDWKSHVVGSAAENWQLRSYAVLLRRAYDLEAVIVQLIEPGADGEPPFRSTATFTREDLGRFEAELKKAFARISAAREALAKQPADVPEALAEVGVRFSLGNWCSTCASRRFCPAQTGLVRALALTPEQVEAEVTGLLVSPETVGVAHRKLRAVEALVELLRRLVNEAATAYGSVPVAPGLAYGPQPYSARSLDGARSWGILARCYGEEVADAACPPKGTLGGLKDALRPVALRQGRPLAEIEREALATLETEGALSVETKTRMGERKS